MEIIKLNQPTIGTCAVMAWADRHPNVILDHTIFESKDNFREFMVASDITTSKALQETFLRTLELCPYEEWWHQTFISEENQEKVEGWYRLRVDEGAWVCRKNDRIIFITN